MLEKIRNAIRSAINENRWPLSVQCICYTVCRRPWVLNCCVLRFERPNVAWIAVRCVESSFGAKDVYCTHLRPRRLFHSWRRRVGQDDGHENALREPPLSDKVAKIVLVFVCLPAIPVFLQSLFHLASILFWLCLSLSLSSCLPVCLSLPVVVRASVETVLPSLL